jgi:hypothetical protein
MRSVNIDWDRASDPSDDYNCMGMALRFLRWWSPPNAPEAIHNPRDYWPEFITGDSLNVDAFVEAAETRGFKCCDGPEWEEGFEKIVLCHKEGEFTHAAALVAPDIWLSKLGNLSDVEHPLHGIASYGDGRRYMKRPIGARGLQTSSADTPAP